MNFEQLAEEVKCFDSCELKNLPFSAVEHLQIIAALNKNLGVDFATGTLYHMQREVANEARTKNKLVNPVEGSTYSDAVNWNVGAMKPRPGCWEFVKGIQSRRFHTQRANLTEALFKRARSSRDPRIHRTVPGTT